MIQGQSPPIMINSEEEINSSNQFYLTPEKSLLSTHAKPQQDSPSYFQNPSNQIFVCFNGSYEKIEQCIFERDNQDEDQNELIEENHIELQSKWIVKSQSILNELDALILQVQNLQRDSEFDKQEVIPHFDLRGLVFDDEVYNHMIPLFQTNNKSIICDASLQIKKSQSSENSTEEMGYHIHNSTLQRVYNCQHCKSVFVKACSLGGHVSRVHKPVVILQNLKMIQKKIIHRIKKLR